MEGAQIYYYYYQDSAPPLVYVGSSGSDLAWFFKIQCVLCMPEKHEFLGKVKGMLQKHLRKVGHTSAEFVYLLKEVFECLNRILLK